MQLLARLIEMIEAAARHDFPTLSFPPALYSNAARAHEAGVGDWVSIYFYDATGREGQRTIATEAGNGPLASRRTVRGREKECLGYYTAKSEAARPMKAGPRPISPKAV